MKIGTILKNGHTRPDNPLHLSIVVKEDARYYTAAYVYKGKFRTAKYAKHDMGEVKPIGYVDLTKVFQRIIDAPEVEPRTCDDCWLRRDFGYHIPAGYCADKCAKIYNALKGAQG